MELKPEVVNWFRTLNSESALPDMALRRNSEIYPLVSYVNHTVALYLSGNIEGVLMFIERAEDFMHSNPSIADNYYAQVEEYFSVIKQHHT